MRLPAPGMFPGSRSARQRPARAGQAVAASSARALAPGPAASMGDPILQAGETMLREELQHAIKLAAAARSFLQPPPAAELLGGLSIPPRAKICSLPLPQSQLIGHHSLDPLPAWLGVCSAPRRHTQCRLSSEAPCPESPPSQRGQAAAQSPHSAQCGHHDPPRPQHQLHRPALALRGQVVSGAVQGARAREWGGRAQVGLGQPRTAAALTARRRVPGARPPPPAGLETAPTPVAPQTMSHPRYL